jgi:hypothetical protein
MDAVDRIVEEQGVVARPVVGVFLGFVGDPDPSWGEEFMIEAVDFLSAPRPERDVIDADRLVGVVKLRPG